MGKVSKPCRGSSLQAQRPASKPPKHTKLPSRAEVAACKPKDLLGAKNRFQCESIKPITKGEKKLSKFVYIEYENREIIINLQTITRVSWQEDTAYVYHLNDEDRSILTGESAKGFWGLITSQLMLTMPNLTMPNLVLVQEEDCETLINLETINCVTKNGTELSNCSTYIFFPGEQDMVSLYGDAADAFWKMIREKVIAECK